MAQQRYIDHIEYGGEEYEFIDSNARNSVTSLATRVTNLNQAQTEAIASEKERAEAAEQALQNSKLNVEPGKGLSTNDFTDDYKDLLDNPLEFTGATASEDGAQGDVPAPTTSDVNKYLKGDGTWDIPQDTTYSDATQSTHGLMSASDKTKLDGMDQEPDDVMACETTFSGNQIVQVLGNGKTKTITFNNDGTITEVITKSGRATITLLTEFNDDGSISRTRS